MVSEASLNMILTDPRLGSNAVRVALHLMNTKPKNFSHQEVADTIGSSRPTVCRAISVLSSLNIIPITVRQGQLTKYG